MATLRLTEWQKLPVSLKELCINTTLQCGQSFRWERSEQGEWSCVLHGRLILLRQDSQYLHYRTGYPCVSEALVTPPSTMPPSLPLTYTSKRDATEKLLRHYLNLEPSLEMLYEKWSSVDCNFKKKASKFRGVRILKQDAWESLICFICSSNNNITRISQMVKKLCNHYGNFIGKFNDQSFYDFPTPAALSGPKVELHLRELGFGYRAKYIYRTALSIAKERSEGWLDSLKNPEDGFSKESITSEATMKSGRDGYREAHKSLLELPGVGSKVADCICLMGLGWGEAVPVDTHVWQIAQRDYKFSNGKHKTLTKTTYDGIGDHFRALWGQDAGWAHSVLFTADLRNFSDRLSSNSRVKEARKRSLTTNDLDEALPSEIDTDPKPGEDGMQNLSSHKTEAIRRSKRRRQH